MSTMNKTATTITMSTSSTAPTPANTAITTPSRIQNPLKEEAARLFHCATSSSLALRSPSLTRMRECRYPLRFSKYNNIALTNHLTLALLSTLAVASSLRRVAADQTFTGQWNGEWLANSNGYSDYDHDDDGSETRVYSMWWDFLSCAILCMHHYLPTYFWYWLAISWCICRPHPPFPTGKKTVKKPCHPTVL